MRRTYARSLSEAFPDERSYVIETPRGIRMSLPSRIDTKPSLLRRFVRFFLDLAAALRKG